MGCTAPTRTTIETLVGNIIDKMRETASVSSIVDLGGGVAQINTSDTGTLTISDEGETVNPYVTIGGTSYQVVAVVADTSFNVKYSGGLPSGSTWKADAPYFFKGNLIDQSQEIDRTKDFNQKYPAIIMPEITSIRLINDPLDINEMVASISLFFMNLANYEDWSIDDFYTKVVDKMELLAIDFNTEADKHRHTGELDDFDATINKISKWGVFTIINGADGQETLFNDNLSGVQYSIDLPVKRSLNSECC